MAPMELETERLLLRPHRLDDLAGRAAMVGDPHVTRFVGGPQSDEENWARLLRYAGHWHLLGWGPYAVIEKSSGRFAGELGLMRFDRGLGPDFDPCPEGMWVVARFAEGKGYTSEAMRAVLADRLERLGPERLVCVIDPENLGSVALAHKLGFTAFDSKPYKGKTCQLFARGAAL